MSDPAVNIVRTLVAALAGSLGAFFIGHGLNLDSATLNTLLYPMCIGIYQAIAVYSVKRWPNMITLHMLGISKVPVYVGARPPEPIVARHDVTIETEAVTLTEPKPDA